MTVYLKCSLLAVAFACWTLLSHVGSAAVGNDGSLSVPSEAGQPVTLEIPAGLDHGQIDASEWLQVYVGSKADWHEDKAPIAGRYEADSRSVKFSPKFAFVERQYYVVRVRLAGEADGISHKLTSFSIQPTSPVVNPEVTAIYPSGESLPENALRFYLHFSTPMKPHVAFEYIKLVDASGNVDDAAFMNFKQELWSEDRKRLTVLMDPGRIKRNVDTNHRLGPALKKGERYQLVVESGWPAAIGTEPLAKFSKSFFVSDALRELPSTESWGIAAPAIHTKDVLKIMLDRPFDHQLLHRYMRVFSVAGTEIRGNVSVDNHETHWHFKPIEAWVDDRITIVVDSELEDVAGNNFQDLLDHSIKTKTKNISQINMPVDLTSKKSQ